ncbi:unnamed protein product [Alternaria alternata]
MGMATGFKSPATLEECAHGEKLVGSSADRGIGLIRIGHSDDPTYEKESFRSVHIALMEKKEGLAWSFDKCPTLLSSSLEIDVTPYFRVDWPVKAAIASWELGVTLRAKGFQNYAIKRLFEAFSRPLSQPLTPALLAYVFERHQESFAEGSSQLQLLLQDVVVRNWGDTAIIDHTAQELWSFFLGLCPSFREDFVSATKHSLEKRQEEELDFAKYLIH